MSAMVIKAGATSRQPHASAFNFDDLTSQAERYLGEVRGEAAKIVAEAQRQADAIRRQAEQDGKKAAFDAAERVLDEKVGKQMATLLPALRKVVDSVGEAKAACMAQWERNVVHLATRIASRVIRREVAASPQITAALLRESLELALGSGKVAIRLHPTDHATLAGQVKALTGEFARLAPAEMIADPTITPGGCKVETEFGTIDQTFEAQLARIEEELT